MLKYKLIENQMTERSDDYMAITESAGSFDREKLISLMLQRGTLLTRTDILAVLNLFDEVISDAISEGNTINLPLFNTSFSLSGVFEGIMDTFDGGRHKLNVNLSKGTLLRNAESRVKFQKTDAIAPMPSIIDVKDVVSGTSNDLLTAGGVIQLWGSNLRIQGELAEVGLWFVPENGEPIKAEVIVTNKPASIIAMIPTLTAGNYTLRIVTQYSGSSKGLITPKVTTYDRTLKVL